jgi:penicillin-binding protein 2
VDAFAGFPYGAFPVGGKTGTAQVFGQQDTALFCAIGPLPTSRYAVAVIMEQAGLGAQAAAPVARRILEGLAGLPAHPVTLSSGDAPD